MRFVFVFSFCFLFIVWTCGSGILSDYLSVRLRWGSYAMFIVFNRFSERLPANLPKIYRLYSVFGKQNPFWANWNKNNGFLGPILTAGLKQIYILNRKCGKSLDAHQKSCVTPKHQIHKAQFLFHILMHQKRQRWTSFTNISFFDSYRVCSSFVRDYYCYWNLPKCVFFKYSIYWTAYRMRFKLEFKCISQWESHIIFM